MRDRRARDGLGERAGSGRGADAARHDARSDRRHAVLGTVATFADADPGAKQSDYLATIDWGDGHATAGTVAGDTSGGFRVEGSSTNAAAAPTP